MSFTLQPKARVVPVARGFCKTSLTHAATLRLIHAVKTYKALWDRKAKFYGNHDYAMAAWNCIILDLFYGGHPDADYSVVTWSNLRAAYFNHTKTKVDLSSDDMAYIKEMEFMSEQDEKHPVVCIWNEDIWQLPMVMKHFNPMLLHQRQAPPPPPKQNHQILERIPEDCQQPVIHAAPVNTDQSGSVVARMDENDDDDVRSEYMDPAMREGDISGFLMDAETEETSDVLENPKEEDSPVGKQLVQNSIDRNENPFFIQLEKQLREEYTQDGFFEVNYEDPTIKEHQKRRAEALFRCDLNNKWKQMTEVANPEALKDVSEEVTAAQDSSNDDQNAAVLEREIEEDESEDEIDEPAQWAEKLSRKAKNKNPELIKMEQALRDEYTKKGFFHIFQEDPLVRNDHARRNEELFQSIILQKFNKKGEPKNSTRLTLPEIRAEEQMRRYKDPEYLQLEKEMREKYVQKRFFATKFQDNTTRALEIRMNESRFQQRLLRKWYKINGNNTGNDTSPLDTIDFNKVGVLKITQETLDQIIANQPQEVQEVPTTESTTVQEVPAPAAEQAAHLEEEHQFVQYCFMFVSLVMILLSMII